MSVGGCVAVALAALATAPPHVSAQDDLELRLDRVRSMQVTAGLFTFPELGLGLESLQGPFKAVLRERRVKLDQNNYENVVSAHLQIARTQVGNSTIYAVRLTSEYREPCTVDRLKLSTMCAVWEASDLMEIFDNVADVRKYVAKTVSKQAAEFSAVFPQK
jgi:hypothetical protein